MFVRESYNESLDGQKYYMNKLDVILIIHKSMNDKIHRNTKHKKTASRSQLKIIANDFDPSI